MDKQLIACLYSFISCHILMFVLMFVLFDFMCCQLAWLTWLYLVATGLARYTI